MKRDIMAALMGLFLCSGAGAQQAADSVAPEIGGAGRLDITPAVAAGLEAKEAGQPVWADDWMIVAANPYAAEAGARVLRAGGTAADAAIATQLVLGLVEPQSSGLGGGAFVVWYDADTGTLSTLDGRETAPLAATPRLFQDDTGAPLKFFDAVVGGRSVGTPGTPALLQLMHRKWGRAEWADLFSDALGLAQEGFVVSERLAGSVARDAARLARFADTARYFLPDGQALRAGSILRNDAYARTLRMLAEQGAEAFYTGDFADQIVRRVQQNGGVLTAVDMAVYRPKERAAVCAPYKSLEICGMGPPSSGALTVGQILGMLAQFDLSAGPDDPQVLRLIGDASRLAFADRARFMADSDYVPVPVQGLLEPDYLKPRAALLRGPRLPEAPPGNPKFDHASRWADDAAPELPSTSHISIVDRYGNALSMTTTIENGFGSRLMVHGFLLNNELTDFSFRSHLGGVPVANRVEPGKRPRSSMAPTIVMRDGAPVLVTGSPGGSMIIGYVANTILAWAEWGLDVQQAMDLPHRINRFGRYDIETGPAALDTMQSLSDMGYGVKSAPMVSGLGSIEIGPRLSGGADKRREGVAIGE